MLTLRGGGHFDGHLWRWVIVPLDLTQLFGAISALSLPHLYRTITYKMHAWFKSMQERQLMLNKNCLVGLTTKKFRGTITHLHTWRQHGRRSWLPLQISLMLPFKHNICCPWNYGNTGFFLFPPLSFIPPSSIPNTSSNLLTSYRHCNREHENAIDSAQWNYLPQNSVLVWGKGLYIVLQVWMKVNTIDLEN